MPISVGTHKIGNAILGGGGINRGSLGNKIVWGVTSDGGDDVDMTLPDNTLGLLVDMTESQVLNLTSLLYTQKVRTWKELPITTNVEIDWGDGSNKLQTDCTDQSVLSHTYADAKKYFMKISGDVTWFIPSVPDYDAGYFPVMPASNTGLAEHVTEIHTKGTCPIKYFIVLGSEVGYEVEFFINCRKLTKIEGNIFSGLTKEHFNQSETMLFSIFSGCTSYTPNVNEILANYLTRATELQVTKLLLAHWFLTYSKNVVLSDDTFAMLPKTITELDLSYMFSYSDVTSIPTNFFTPIPNSSTTTMDFMFSNCSNLTGNVPPVWNTHPNTTHKYFFDNCSKITNYSSIPSGWK